MDTTFTPLASLGGGVLIGLGTVLLMATHGRIMGATGILTGLFAPESRGDRLWRAAVLLGMLLGPAVYLVATGQAPEIEVPVSTPVLIGGAVLVGLGVSWGNGCTSGHGVCGLARLSPRSIAATATFMAAAFVTVFVTRHLLGA